MKQQGEGEEEEVVEEAERGKKQLQCQAATGRGCRGCHGLEEEEVEKLTESGGGEVAESDSTALTLKTAAATVKNNCPADSPVLTASC